MAERASDDTRADRRARLFIVAAALATFGAGIPLPLQRSWDDGRFLVDNPDVQRISWSSFVSIVTKPHFEAYHPLHLLSYWIDLPLAGPSAPVLHAVSLVLFVLALQVVYLFFRSFSLRPLTALLGTLACGLHPVQVEAVVWATGRKEVLALAFASASLLFHLRSSSAWDRPAWSSRVCYVLAALSKTTTLPLPLVALLIDLLARRVPVREALKRQLPALALASVLGAVVIAIWQKHQMTRELPAGVLPGAVRAIETLSHQLHTAFWPARNSPMYSVRDLGDFDASSTVALLGSVISLVYAYRIRAREPRLLVFLLAFLVLFAPVSNLLPMYFPYQDRYLLLPLLALAGAVAVCTERLSSALRSSWPAVVLGIAVGLSALRTVQYSREWSSELRLWGHAAATQPDAEYAFQKLGAVRRDAGDLEGAIAAYRTLVHLTPLRKLSYAALFEAVALRDEGVFGIAPSRARQYARRYYESMEDTHALGELASELLASSYLRALELPLAHLQGGRDDPDALLEHTALAQLRAGRPSLARFYALALRDRPRDPALAELLDAPYFRVLP